MPVDPKYRMKILESKRSLKTEKRPPRPAKVNVRPWTSADRAGVQKRSRIRGDRLKHPEGRDRQRLGGGDARRVVLRVQQVRRREVSRYLGLRPLRPRHGHAAQHQRLSRVVLAPGLHDVGLRADRDWPHQLLPQRRGRGRLLCVAQLQSYPTSAPATVECLIDNQSFGNLPFTGMIIQPHFCVLSAGGHHFRIRQVSGSFYFLSVHVYHL